MDILITNLTKTPLYMYITFKHFGYSNFLHECHMFCTHCRRGCSVVLESTWKGGAPCTIAVNKYYVYKKHPVVPSSLGYINHIVTSILRLKDSWTRKQSKSITTFKNRVVAWVCIGIFLACRQSCLLADWPEWAEACQWVQANCMRAWTNSIHTQEVMNV